MIASAVARFVEAQAADQPPAVEVAAVGHAGVQAVAHQVIDFVDVDRPGQHAAKNSLRAVVGFAGNQRRRRRADRDCQSSRSTSATSRRRESSGGRALRARRFAASCRSSIGWPNGQWPTSCSSAAASNSFGILRRDGGRESFVGGQPIEVLDRRQENAERMFLPRVVGGRIDQAHQPQLADLRQAGETRPCRSAAARESVSGTSTPGGIRTSPPRAAPAADFGNVVDGGHG